MAEKLTRAIVISTAISTAFIALEVLLYTLNKLAFTYIFGVLLPAAVVVVLAVLAALAIVLVGMGLLGGIMYISRRDE